jgi:hypothetical protein
MPKGCGQRTQGGYRKFGDLVQEWPVGAAHGRSLLCGFLVVHFCAEGARTKVPTSALGTNNIEAEKKKKKAERLPSSVCGGEASSSGKNVFLFQCSTLARMMSLRKKTWGRSGRDKNVRS